MELNYYIDSEYFTGTIPTNLEAPKLPDFSIPVKYSTGSGGVSYRCRMKEIQLSQGKVALVDDEDFDLINKFKWFTQKDSHTFYARTIIGMHRLILNAPTGMQVDHLDGDGLNNLKENLRLCSQAENQHNQRNFWGESKYKGVFRDKRWPRRWRSKIKIAGRAVSLGGFATEVEAASAYDEVALKHHDKFVFTNRMKFPEDFGGLKNG